MCSYVYLFETRKLFNFLCKTADIKCNAGKVKYVRLTQKLIKKNKMNRHTQY